MKNIFTVPSLRQELHFKVVEEEGVKFLSLTDPTDVALQPAVIPVDLIPLLQLMNGTMTNVEIEELIKSQIPEDTDFIISVFFDLLHNLDFIGLLDSPRFQLLKEELNKYIQSPVREPVCAGTTYPVTKELLIEEMNKIMATSNPELPNYAAKAIIIPHIDFKVGEIAHKTYSAGYHAIEKTEADLFVIFGTSHYSAASNFLLTYKDFRTPLGLVQTDKTLLNQLRNQVSYNLSFDDKAHRYEHSIEIQLPFLQQIFHDRDFTILPILVGSFENFFFNNSLPLYDSKLKEFLEVLSKVIHASGRKTVYIASVDLSHIGKKFGDKFDAETELERAKKEDLEIVEILKTGNAAEFFKEVAKSKNKNKICGLSPIYALLSILNPTESQFLNYEQWYEKETGSSVSFTSIAYY